MEIVDVVLARDELDLGAFRATYLSPVVTKTYFGEARFTHSGLSKPLYFRDCFEQKLKGDVDWESLEIPKFWNTDGLDNRWIIERGSREWLVSQVIERHPDAVVILSDLDEIPSLEQMRGLAENNRMGPRTIPMQMSYRRANWVVSQFPTWRKAKVFSAKKYQTGLRLKAFPPIFGTPGVHFSYLGMDARDIAKKYSEFAHAEYDNPELSSDFLVNLSDTYAISHLGHFFKYGAGLLSVLNERQLGPVQRAMLDFGMSSVFNFDRPSGNLLERARSSWRLTRHVRRERKMAKQDS